MLQEIGVLDGKLALLPAFRGAVRAAAGDGLSDLSLEDIMFAVADRHAGWFSPAASASGDIARVSGRR